MRTKTAKQNRRSKIVEFLKITKIVYNIRLLTCKYVDLFVYERAQSTNRAAENQNSKQTPSKQQ